MRKYLTALFVLISVFACNRDKNREVYYFYDAENVFNIAEGSKMIHYKISIPIYASWGDSMTMEISNKGYFLLHFFGDYEGLPQDTSFNKPASFLNSIDYFDSEWLKKEENLKTLWPDSMFEHGGPEDTVEIYLIHPIPETDSIKLERVHRWYMPNREG